MNAFDEKYGKYEGGIPLSAERPNFSLPSCREGAFRSSARLQTDEADPANADPTTSLLPFLESQDSETTDNLSSHIKQQQRRRHFVRLDKTGWSFSSSEDEESAFDDRLFFRYLYDSSSTSSSSSGEEEGELTEGQDHDDGPLTAPFFYPPKVESLPFELAESWDGGVVFTNGEAGNGDRKSVV